VNTVSRELSEPVRPARRAVPAHAGGRWHAADTVEPLLRLDPDLGEHLPRERRAAAERELLVPTTRLAAGRLEPARYLRPSVPGLGLLLVRGLVARELCVGDMPSAELFAPGDLVRTAGGEEEPQTLQTAVSWIALTPGRAAILDAGVLPPLLTRFPEVLLAIVQRSEARAQRLALNQAISQMTGVDRRLEALLWYLADRWGKVTRDGVLVPVPLSHRMLGTLVGARRPTVSTALAGLAARGYVRRRTDGWLLTGPTPPAPADDGSVPHRRRFASAPERADPLAA
jgi:CRP/FNR family cyclic AMP-dependent transcriptional regulator